MSSRELIGLYLACWHGIAGVYIHEFTLVCGMDGPWIGYGFQGSVLLYSFIMSPCIDNILGGVGQRLKNLWDVCVSAARWGIVFESFIEKSCVSFQDVRDLCWIPNRLELRASHILIWASGQVRDREALIEYFAKIAIWNYSLNYGNLYCVVRG